MKKVLVSTICSILFLISFASGSDAQPTAVNIHGSGTPPIPYLNKTFSPSVTEHGSNGDQYSAYTYITGSQQRAVAISVSTDNGTSWTVKKKFDGTDGSLPKWNTGSVQDNSDEAQIISNGSTLLLVVRAWSSAYEAGSTTSSDKEQTANIFLRSGIYITSSTDNGTTWGYWVGSTWTTDVWAIVAENPFFSPLDPTANPTTLENPRIAWRPDYNGTSTTGYVVWGRKRYSSTSSGNYTVTGGSLGSGTLIGIRAFDANGKLYSTSANFDFASVSLGSGGTRFAERPSVAIAPDATPWVSFYSIEYPSGSSVNKPRMHIWYTHGTTNSSTGLVNLPNPTELNPSVEKYVFGHTIKLGATVMLGSIC